MNYSAVPNSIVDIHADVTTFSSSAHGSLGTVALQTNLKQDIYSLCDWSSGNRMVLNANKTKSMPVTGKRLKSQKMGLVWIARPVV